MRTDDPIQWMFAEGEDIEFDHADAIAITDVSAGTLQNWVSRGLFNPSGGGGSRGLRRKYSIQDLVVLAMSAKLVDLNVSPSVSLELALDVWCAAARELLETRRASSWTGCLAFIKTEKGGSRETVIVSGSNTFDFESMMDGQPVIMFAAGVVMKATAERAMELASPDSNRPRKAAIRPSVSK